MKAQRECLHLTARFHSIQRLGSLPPVELWYCPLCKSTISIESVREARRKHAA